MKACLLILLLLATTATATNDVGLTIDGQGLDICIAVDNFTNYACDLNETLMVDGTADHTYYLINKPTTIQKDLNVTNSGDMIELILTPYNVVGALLSIIVLCLIALLCFAFLVRLAQVTT